MNALSGGGTIRVWRSDERTGEYFLGEPIPVSEFVKQGDWLVKDLWVEGVTPHTLQQEVVLQMTFDQAPGQDDRAAVTVIGIEKVQWIGRRNSRNDTNNLRRDPNFPARLPPGAREVFPDARVVNGKVEAQPRDIVDVEVTLSVKPVRPVDVTLRSFDVDDPSAESNAVDDDFSDFTPSDDNRGSGAFVGAGDTVTKTFAEIKQLVPFRVSMQPGDNFRVIANGDAAFVARLSNHDQALNQGSDEGERNANKQRVVDMNIVGTPADQEIRESNKYASDTLTVWRFLHVESDAMGEPGKNEPFLGAGNGGDSEPGADDVRPHGDQHPNTGLLRRSYRPAYILVVEDLKALDIKDGIPFVHNFDPRVPRAVDKINESRDVPSTDRFWVVHLVGAYEFGLQVPKSTEVIGDFDPPIGNRDDPKFGNDDAVLGITPDAIDGPILIFRETIRDRQAYRGNKERHVTISREQLEARTVLHETLHRLNVNHGESGDEGPLVPTVNLFGTDDANKLTSTQLDIVRRVNRPQ